TERNFKKTGKTITNKARVMSSKRLDGLLSCGVSSGTGTAFCWSDPTSTGGPLNRVRGPLWPLSLQVYRSTRVRVMNGLIPTSLMSGSCAPVSVVDLAYGQPVLGSEFISRQEPSSASE